MSRIIGVDVDLTVCPSDQGWLRWLDDRCTNYSPAVWLDFKSEVMKLPYNLGGIFKEEVEDPMDYWRTLEYSQFQPLEGSVEKLKSLSTYFDIVFISAIKGRHNKEKYYWLKEHFPFMSGYIATKEKFLMNTSVVAMIDDRKDNLEKFDYNKRVLYSTPYEQSSDCSVNMVISDWKDFSVKSFCDEYLN